MTDNSTENGADNDWARAMAEQASAEGNDDGGADPWAEALAEQKAQDNAESSPEPAPRSEATRADETVFKQLAGEDKTGAPRDLDMIMDIPVTLSVELGQTRLTIRELLDLAQGSVVELDGLAGEPMSILVNGYLIAHGEVVVVEDKYGIRITEIVTRSERLHKLHK